MRTLLLESSRRHLRLLTPADSLGAISSILMTYRTDLTSTLVLTILEPLRRISPHFYPLYYCFLCKPLVLSFIFTNIPLSDFFNLFHQPPLFYPLFYSHSISNPLPIPLLYGSNPRVQILAGFLGFLAGKVSFFGGTPPLRSEEHTSELQSRV